MLYTDTTINERSELLSETPWAEGMTPHDLQTLAVYMKLVKVARGKVILKEGGSDSFLSVIIHGKVQVMKENRDSHPTVIATLNTGKSFGEMSILNNKPRSASATVEEPAKLLVIDPKTFEAMVRGNAEIAVRMIKKLAQRLQEADEQIENLLLKDHNSRVVHFLAHFATRTGQKQGDGTVIQLTVKDLASKVDSP